MSVITHAYAIGTAQAVANSTFGGASTPVVFDDAQALMDWHTAESITPALIDLARISYRKDETAAIAAIVAGAGLETGESTGPADGVTVGLTDAGALVTRGQILINDEGDASSLAVSGDGSSGDPYILENHDCFGDTGRALKLDDADADYYITFRNCRFRDGTAFEIDMTAFGTIPVFENCEVYDSTNTGGDTWCIRYSADVMHWKKSLFSGAGCSHIHGLNGSTAGVILEDCLIDQSVADCNSNTRMVSCVVKPASIQIIRTEFDGSNGTQSSAAQYAIDIAAGCTSLDVQNTLFTEYKHAIGNSNGAAVTGLVNATVWKNNECVDQHAECLLMYNATTIDAQNNTFKHLTNGSGFRPVLFNGDLGSADHHCASVTFKYNHIVKTDGTNTAGNEALESVYSGTLDWQYNYIEGCTEDGIELVFPMDKAEFTRTIANNYIKDCDNQGIDIFGQGDYSAWAKITGPNDLSAHNDLNTYIHDNYGNADKESIVLSGCRGVFGGDNYITNSDGGGSLKLLRIEERTTGEIADVEPRNIQFSGPFALPADRQDGTINGVAELRGTTHDCEIKFFDNAGGTGVVTTVSS